MLQLIVGLVVLALVIWAGCYVIRRQKSQKPAKKYGSLAATNDDFARFSRLSRR